jgi:hypothetical protein
VTVWPTDVAGKGVPGTKGICRSHSASTGSLVSLSIVTVYKSGPIKAWGTDRERRVSCSLAQCKSGSTGLIPQQQITCRGDPSLWLVRSLSPDPGPAIPDRVYRGVGKRQAPSTVVDCPEIAARTGICCWFKIQLAQVLLVLDSLGRRRRRHTSRFLKRKGNTQSGPAGWRAAQSGHGEGRRDRG